MLLVAGGFRISLGIGATQGALRRAMILSGALLILLAVMIFANFPQSAAVVLGAFVAVELISNGVSQIALALARKAGEA